jgi:hypothetical protein
VFPPLTILRQRQNPANRATNCPRRSPHTITSATEYNEPAIRTGSFLPSAVGDRTTQNVYVVYQALLAGNPRIAFTKSTDGGITWSTPFAISNNPPGSGVFNPAINVSPDGRTITVAFYDHRDNPGSTVLVDLYLAQSFDFGNTWQPNIRLTFHINGCFASSAHFRRLHAWRLPRRCPNYSTDCPGSTDLG